MCVCVCWRMTWITVTTVLLLVTQCVSSAEENDTIELKYRQATITAARGSSAILSCVAKYDFDKCSLLHVVWQQVNNNNTELIDPNKYLTTVNETIYDGNRRVRQVVTEILDLTPKDSGQFQCNAVCENEETARGHFIYITVTD
ncbi:uncharacterized protein zgc:174945 [Scomber scombrus]|uniref:Uncharacterized protein zgc:174945 n=1 Tax=Scomber scombrus TaxID=13677 RepID=A0AAV1PA28_SCOSC